MSSIASYFSSGLSYTRNAISLCAKAVAIPIVSTPLKAMLIKSGLGMPITAVARKLEFAAAPFRSGAQWIYQIMQYIAPSVYYTSRLPLPNEEECYPASLYPYPQYQCKLFNSYLLAGLPEELVMRGFLQRTALPWVARQCPGAVGNVLNHRITRIALASLIFAAAHSHYDDVSAAFTGGVIYGTVAEVTQSLKIPILAHTMHNALGVLLFAMAGEDGKIHISIPFLGE